MKYYTLLTSSLVTFANLLGTVFAAELTLYETAIDIDLSEITVIAVPIGTANGATTYLEDMIMVYPTYNGAFTETTVTYTGATLIASAGGWKLRDRNGEKELEEECSNPDGQGNGECIMRVSDKSTTVEVTHTGSMMPIVASISEPTVASATGSTSGSPSSASASNSDPNHEFQFQLQLQSTPTRSSSGHSNSDSPSNDSSSGSSANNENGARRLVCGMMSTIVGGIIFGGLLVI